ncbi:lytic transglycosylase domain-containing protein, partial [Neisseria gonorrhoeae]
DPAMLQSIALTESAFRPNIESHTADIGLMGINRSWLPVLHKKFGLTGADVWNPCTNVHIGAWILANSYRQHGKSWEAVGAYNAACTKLKGRACYRARMTYANKVYQNWKRLKTRSS